jgi:tetratricopeptide (TPR) repeat protein
VRKATRVFDRVFGVNCSVRLARSYRPACLLSFLLILIPNKASAQSGVNSGASWSQYKSQCGIPASTAYNDWVAQGSHCPKTESASSTSPAVPALNPQQQLAMQGAAVAGNMIGQALGQLLFGKPTPPTEPAQPDPEQQQRELAAQQLNNSGLYLLKQKNYAGAINEFQKALAIIPNDSNTLHNLALARQKLKDAAVAGQTSSALGQFLGNAPANTGSFGFAQLTGSTAANPNPSALSLVNLDSDANVVDLRGTTKTSVDPESLKGQLDAALGNNPPVSAQPNSQVVLPQDKDMELLSTLSEPGTSQSQVVLPQDKDMELLSILSEPGTSQSQVVLSQDKDMELLSTLSQPGPSQSHVAPPSSGKANFTPASRSSPATPASNSSLKDAPNDNPTPASRGTGKCAFGTTCNPANPDLNSSAAPPVAVHSTNDQASSAARSGAAAIGNGKSDGAKVESNCVFDTSACASPAPVPMNKAVAQTPRTPANIQIPASMANDPEVRLLNRYKQQTQDAYNAAAVAQAKYEAEQKKNPQSNQLIMLQEQAKEAQEKAGSLDRMVTFQTGEVQRKITFATINTGDNGAPASPPNN